MTEGWVKNWRSIKEWEWYRVPNMAHLFQHLIREANHDERRWQGLTIERGQIVTGLQSLHRETGISVQSLRTCLERLKSTGEITSKSTNHFRIITIQNYDVYQDYDGVANKQINKQSNNPLTSNQQATNSKQELKNEKNVKKREYTPESLQAVISYFKEIGSNETEAQKFFDYFSSNGWRVAGRTAMKDWKAAARNWKRNASNFAPRNQRPDPPRPVKRDPKEEQERFERISNEARRREEEFERKRQLAQEALNK